MDAGGSIRCFFGPSTNPETLHLPTVRAASLVEWHVQGNGYVPKAEAKVDESWPLPKDMALAGDCPCYANKTPNTTLPWKKQSLANF